MELLWVQGLDCSAQDSHRGLDRKAAWEGASCTNSHGFTMERVARGSTKGCSQMESWKKRTGNSPSVGARADMGRLVGHGMDEAVLIPKSEVKVKLKKICGFLGACGFSTYHQ